MNDYRGYAGKPKMKPVTTLEEAQALPERRQLSYKKRKNADGTTTTIPYFRDMGEVDLTLDAIWIFEDKDGRSMQIDYDSEGAYKYEVRLY